MKTLVALAAGALAAGGIALASPANAGCQSGWTPFGSSTTCDGPLNSEGAFQRCISTDIMGWGSTNCQVLNVNNLAGQIPYVGP